jgi:hypothetical protein
MIKYIFVIGLISLSIIDAKAQYVTSSNNPFSKLRFLNAPIDTITLIADYNHIIGKISDDNMNMFSVINKNNRSDLRDFTYAIGFTIPGYLQKFYAPSRDNMLYNILSSRQTGTIKLKLNCVVYRFYYMDNTYNFFYIAKGTVLD